MGQMDAPSSWKTVKLVFSRKPDAEPKNGISGCGVIALTSVISKWYAFLYYSSSEKAKRTQEL